ncbi:MAG: ROK family protein [Clostridia bacterium]|nr:ROK family protein [Clostridia bacterium]
MNLKFPAILDPGFQPMELVLREFEKEVLASEHQKLSIALERHDGYCEAFSFDIFADGVNDEKNFAIAERYVKTLLWVFGGWKVYIHGSRPVYEFLRAAYQRDGLRQFDVWFMGDRVYERPFEVAYVENAADMPSTRHAASAVGRHLKGCRIGFDAGGSDRKVSAVIDGETVYSEEVVWHPKTQSDPEYHFSGIMEAFRTAASQMPRVDGIGVSTAGVTIANRMMVAALFIKVSEEDFERRVKNIYLDAARELGENIPIEVANDGDVTALAGAMDLNENGVLGIAMGTSEAGGYVDPNGNITGWLNELAFAPVDFNREAAVDEWSGDYGCGVKYFSQDGVIKLAPAAGIDLEESLTPAEKLKVVQKLMEQDDPRAAKIYETIGTYFGYTLAYYARFYEIRHTLIMGRVTSGKGGEILLARAREVLEGEFPEIAEKMQLNIPSEASRRVGQSIAAASLPEDRV